MRADGASKKIILISLQEVRGQARFLGVNVKSIMRTKACLLTAVLLQATCASALAQTSTVQFASTTYRVSEFAGAAIVTVERIGEPGGAAYLEYRTVDGTARAGEDYEARRGQLFFFGETNLTIYIPIFRDAIDETQETFMVEFTWARPDDTQIGIRSNCVVTVDDTLGDNRLDEWTWSVRDPVVTDNLYRVTYGNGLFVAVGDAGTIVTSTNGRNWQPAASVTSNTLRGVTFGTNRFVTVGDSGTILSSPDGETWMPHSSGSSMPLSDVEFGGGLFVAVGMCGNILTSRDGLSWNIATNEECLTRDYYTDFRSIAHGKGTFAAVGMFINEQVAPGCVVYTSADGGNWTGCQCSAGCFNRDIAFGNDTFVAVGDWDIYSSTSGLAWNPAPQDTRRALKGIAFGMGTFIAVGLASQWQPPKDISVLHMGMVAIPDSIGVWRGRFLDGVPPLRSVAFGNGTFVAVGGGGAIVQGVPVVNLGIAFADSPTLTISGPLGAYRIQTASDPTVTNGWTTAATISVTNNPQVWADTQATNSSQRFYRAVLLP